MLLIRGFSSKTILNDDFPQVDGTAISSLIQGDVSAIKRVALVRIYVCEILNFFVNPRNVRPILDRHYSVEVCENICSDLFICDTGWPKVNFPKFLEFFFWFIAEPRQLSIFLRIFLLIHCWTEAVIHLPQNFAFWFIAESRKLSISSENIYFYDHPRSKAKAFPMLPFHYTFTHQLSKQRFRRMNVKNKIVVVFRGLLILTPKSSRRINILVYRWLRANIRELYNNRTNENFYTIWLLSRLLNKVTQRLNKICLENAFLIIVAFKSHETYMVGSFSVLGLQVWTHLSEKKQLL